MYGPHGSYWNAFLANHRSPVLIDTLQTQDYDFLIQTSTSFSYPEFDQTLFSGLPDDFIHEADKDLPPWQRDRNNTDRIVDFLHRQSAAAPFMLFQFYESTHARYDFPAEAVIRQPYTQSLNFASISRESLAPNITPLKNRYINASHWVDTQMGRVLQALHDTDLMRNTIVVISGDHGEEFMENGFWGHNAGFSQWQIRVPMVIHLPNRPPPVIHDDTSHVDVEPTIASYLGITSAADTYSQGLPVWSVADRQRLVVSDWQGIALLQDGLKFTIPPKMSFDTRNDLYTATDQVVTDPAQFIAEHAQDIQAVLEETRHFTTGQD